jgi:hypothetical protein
MTLSRKAKQTTLEVVWVMLRIGLGCVLLWSSLPKLQQPYDFLARIYEHKLVPASLGMLAAMVIPWFELFLAVGLLGGVFLGGSLLATAGLMAFFIYVQMSAIHRKLSLSCGCFGSNAASISYVTVTRTAALMLAAAIAYGIYLLRSRPKPEEIDIVRHIALK